MAPPAVKDLPVQVPVDEPILNKPYDVPEWHWVYGADGVANKMPGRRPAAYFWSGRQAGDRQGGLEGIEADVGSERLTLVNALRQDVAKWRASGYENATVTTKRLLAHWHDKNRPRRFFFCQLEAVETIIYLREILASGRKPRWGTVVSPEDYQCLTKDVIQQLSGRLDGDAEVASTTLPLTLVDQPNDSSLKPLVRHGCKMATGSGKTIVMGMLIAWAFCNRGAVPGDTRFPSAVLVCCPNLTVKERLEVLKPDSEGSNYYTEFNMVPNNMLGLMAVGKVVVTNWHVFHPESRHAEGGSTYAVVDKGEEGDDAFSRRVLKELYGRGEIMVLNDEAHHAYRPKLAELAEDEGETMGLADKEDLNEATVWVGGLDRINQAVGIGVCVDLSATPFYLGGTGHVEGSPFPWLVSDFGLVDAIESGLTKIPRLPVEDQTGRPSPQFFHLWEHIKSKCAPAELQRGKPKPEAAWREAEAALQMLTSQWKERFDAMQAAQAGQNYVPPVIIVVCDNTHMAENFFEKISGEKMVEVTAEAEEGEDEEEVLPKAAGKRKLRRTYNPSSVIFQELANTAEKQVTVRIDSGLLNEAEAGIGSSKDKEAQKLRELIATVGKKGKPGEHIRCVVSVQMLTEGWDANNVTQILGLRAFGSQLLCEQVVGRGLRRLSYDVGADGKLEAEYVDVYGIPFSIIPFKGRQKDRPEPTDKPTNLVMAMPERAALELKFPNVEGYVFQLNREYIKCDVSKVESIDIKVTSAPNQIYVQPLVGLQDGVIGGANFEARLHTRTEFYEATHIDQILMWIAKEITDNLTNPQLDSSEKFRQTARHQLYKPVLDVVKKYVATRINFNGVDYRELALEMYFKRVIQLLTVAIRPDTESGEPPLLPVLNHFAPFGTSKYVHFPTKKACHPVRKSHVNLVVLDSDEWERSAAQQLELSDEVVAFVKNDHLEFTIPYTYDGIKYNYLPDFVVRMKSGLNLILEVKGQIRDREPHKMEAAKRWVDAVNNWGRFGTWHYALTLDINEIPAILLEATAKEVKSPSIG
jgi:type III restriction enzyme